MNIDNFIETYFEVHIKDSIIYVGDQSNTTEQPKQNQEKQVEDHPIPSELATPKAMKYWQKAQEAGWVDENLQLKISKQYAALLADYLGRKLKLIHKWKDFEELWHIKTLRNDFDKAMSSSKTNQFIDTIKEKLGN